MSEGGESTNGLYALPRGSDIGQIGLFMNEEVATKTKGHATGMYHSSTNRSRRDGYLLKTVRDQPLDKKPPRWQGGSLHTSTDVTYQVRLLAMALFFRICTVISQGGREPVFPVEGVSSRLSSLFSRP